MANEKKNGTLEEIIMEMLKEGKAAFLFLKCERPFDFNFFLEMIFREGSVNGTGQLLCTASQ